MSNKGYVGKTSLTRFLKNLYDKFALKSHTHRKNEISDFPEIPTNVSDLINDIGYTTTKIDDSLLLEGYAADSSAVGKALSDVNSDIDRINDLVGDSSVSEQIAEAINGTGTAVRYDIVQELTQTEKLRARLNIDTGSNVNNAYDNPLKIFNFTWDGTIENKDSFVLEMINPDDGSVEQYTYYKVSDNVPARIFIRNWYEAIAEHISGGVSYIQPDNIFCSMNQFTNWYTLDAFGTLPYIFIEEPGVFVENEIFNVSFNAPSVGVYFKYVENYTSKLTIFSSLKTAINLDSENAKFNIKINNDGSLKTVNSNGDVVWDGSNIEGIVVTDTTLSKEGVPADAEITGNRLSIVESQLADFLYNPIVITSFKNNGNVTTTLEKGATLADVTLIWATDREPKTITLKDNKGYNSSIDVSVTSFKAPNLPITEDRTWTLTVTDERDAVVHKTTNVQFCHGVYYGTVKSGTTITSSVIHDLVDSKKLTKKLQKNKTISKFYVNAGEDEHIMFALPTSYGKPVFKDYDQNIGAGFYKVVPSDNNTEEPSINFINSNDVEEPYDIWLSTNVGLGEINIAVS